ncbi:MAG: aldose epimerase [Symploca sp. SIO2D2]|nr:aldose epimerase [Symploca sp. SIO2D2]
MEEIEYLGEKIRRWQVGSSTFLVWPERGARLMNWNISYADGTFRDIIRWPEIDSPDQVVKARGGNPILFPFSARSFHQGEIHKWKDLEGNVRPMPMHGFARQGQFEIARIDKTGFAARLMPTEEDRESYPYDYDFEVVYRFEEKEVDVELRLSNNDNKVIPWSAGHHFYFNIPWLEGTSRQDYKVRIPAKEFSRQNEDGSLRSVKSNKKPTTVSSADLVERIHHKLTDATILCECEADGSRIEIEVGTQEKPHADYTVVTWTESDQSPFYCIEPWMGPPNSIENEIGCHLVNPGETGRFSVSVRI